MEEDNQSFLLTHNAMKQLTTKSADMYMETRQHFSHSKPQKNKTVIYSVSKNEQIYIADIAPGRPLNVWERKTDGSIPHEAN